ncbi:hypothetical protein HYX10_05550 [Candidatus Woesearchaeota archaeon]|nr:hypothetical protein [Candidatus Woesearchaeota archaeon]
MSKGSLFGVDTIVSYLLFGAFLVFTLIALNIAGCGGQGKVASELTVEKQGIAGLTASEQLSAYLATEIPENLPETVNGLNGEGKEMLRSNVDMPAAVNFLERHPEVYVDKTYGEFITALYALRQEEGSGNVFDVVTRAVFHRRLYPEKIRELNKGRLDNDYFSPFIIVKYGKYNSLEYEDGNLISSVDLMRNYKAVGLKILPTHDSKGVTVGLRIYPEELRDAAPMP